MIVIVDERDTVKDGYTAWFDREGVSATGLSPADFDNWVKCVSEPDMLSVEAFLLGDCASRQLFPKLIRGRSRAPVIAMNDTKSLDETLELLVFSDGRDPEVAGEVLPLPRRERRILEYLVSNHGCRVTKTQIFNYVYGLFSEDIDENVIESHVSKLRK